MHSVRIILLLLACPGSVLLGWGQQRNQSGVRIGSGQRQVTATGPTNMRGGSGIKLGGSGKSLRNITRTTPAPTATSVIPHLVTAPPYQPNPQPPPPPPVLNSKGLPLLNVGLVVPHKSFGLREYNRAVTTAVNGLTRTSSRSRQLSVFQRYQVQFHMVMNSLTPTPTDSSSYDRADVSGTSTSCQEHILYPNEPTTSSSTTTTNLSKTAAAAESAPSSSTWASGPQESISSESDDEWSSSNTSDTGDGEHNILGLGNFIAPNPTDPIYIKKSFLEKHPIQEHYLTTSDLPFVPSKLYFRTLHNGEKIQRKWLSYNSRLKKVYCSCCMAFGDTTHRESPFISGREVNPKHIYSVVETHETSLYHQNAVATAMQACKGGDIDTLLNVTHQRERERQIETRRLVIRRLIDIVLFIGKQGLGYRGGKDEGAHSLDLDCNHGNFLELVLLVSEYDPVLKAHINKCIEDSKQKRNISRKKLELQCKQGKQQVGRGSLLTFLSKSFINKMIKTIALLGRKRILEDVNERIVFGLMVDSTQDVSVMDQCAICVRYVFQGKTYERLLDLCVIEDSSGEGIYNKVIQELNKHGISLTNLVACSFDGAANMKGCYSGLQARLKATNPNILYTHCMGHVLNLVVADSTINCLQAENLFGLVEESACFLHSSHKRMCVWERETKQRQKGSDKLYRLQKIGATRWWSKHKALQAIIDYDLDESNLESSKFVNFLSVLLEISQGNFDCKTKFTARNLIEQWSKFENLFSAYVLLDMFSVTSPVSKFLQAKNLDYCKAWELVRRLLSEIKKKRTDVCFESLLAKLKRYVALIQGCFEDQQIDIETSPKERRIPKKKKMSDELAEDEGRMIPTEQKLKLLYLQILDSASNSINERFVPNKDILIDCSWLNPNKYDEIKANGVPDQVFKKICSITKCCRTELITEMKQLATYYSTFAKKTTDTNIVSYEKYEEVKEVDLSESDAGDSDSGNNFLHGISKHGKYKESCHMCLPCAFKTVYELASQSGLFPNVYLTMKFVMTLPCTQVTCERVFSKLKIVKSRLRSSLSQELLSPLMLMAVERDLFKNIDKNLAIDELANSNEELKLKLLK